MCTYIKMSTFYSLKQKILCKEKTIQYFKTYKSIWDRDLKKNTTKSGTVVHTCNPRCLGG